MAKRLMRESAMDDSLQLLTIIQGMVDAKTGKVSKEAVLIEAVQSGMLQAESEVLLKSLIRNGSVREEEGYVYLY
ncbi:hypothetical protein K9M74_04560 [Candidatus Woesearchaeota archaeon]|nr:hypothetical protein [Candidatus Woesearchaeota archaeon]